MDKRFYSENRRRLAVHMTGNEAMLFFSGESVRKTADENFPFFADRNFLYLTGIHQEQSALLIQKKGDPEADSHAYLGALRQSARVL